MIVLQRPQSCSLGARSGLYPEMPLERETYLHAVIVCTDRWLLFLLTPVELLPRAD